MKTRHNLTMFTGGRWTVRTVQQTFTVDLGNGRVELADRDNRWFPLLDDQRFRIRTIDVLELGKPAHFSMAVPAAGCRSYEYTFTTDPVLSITAAQAKHRDGDVHVDLSHIYDSETPTELTMCRRLGIDSAQLQSLADDGRVLRLVTLAGAVIYPLVQVNEAGRLLPGLDAVLCELAEGTDDPWTWWLWMISKPGWAGGRNVWELLRDGHVNTVIRTAGGAAWVWRE